MRRPYRVLFFIIIVALIALGISLPDGYPIRFKIGGWEVNQVLKQLSLDIQTERFSVIYKPRTVLGLDIAGGARLVYEADMSGIAENSRSDALESARLIIERRVNLFGVTEPVVQTAKADESYRIVVELHGVTEVASAKELIGRTAQLDVREFTEEEATDSGFLLPTTANTVASGLTGKDLEYARVTFDQATGRSVVSLEFTTEGGKLFEEITRRNLGKQLPVFIDEFPVTSPVVQDVISGGSTIISGSFTNQQAKNLAIQLNSGALPVSIHAIEEKTIGPSLGRESIQKSIIAGAIGLISVVVFMVLYYGKLGLLANIAFVIFGLITYAIFRMIPITLTLPGIAGFILSIGMAVDSNILIFERIKEDQRKGKDFRTAFAVGFGKAIDAIKDANIATLLVAFILFNPFNWDFFPQFGLIRGFALTLSIGVLTSIFTGVVITKKIIQIVFINNKNK